MVRKTKWEPKRVEPQAPPPKQEESLEGNVYQHSAERWAYRLVTLVNDTEIYLAVVTVPELSSPAGLPVPWEKVHETAKAQSLDSWRASVDMGKWIMIPELKVQWK
jgi:hypothetical protein